MGLPELNKEIEPDEPHFYSESNEIFTNSKAETLSIFLKSSTVNQCEPYK